jgi:hypothetical protein
MDANSLLTPAWRSELQFQLSLLRLMYPQTGLGAESAQVAELEQLQEPTQGVSAAR